MGKMTWGPSLGGGPRRRDTLGGGGWNTSGHTIGGSRLRKVLGGVMVLKINPMKQDWGRHKNRDEGNPVAEGLGVGAVVGLRGKSSPSSIGGGGALGAVMDDLRRGGVLQGFSQQADHRAVRRGVQNVEEETTGGSSDRRSAPPPLTPTIKL